MSAEFKSSDAGERVASKASVSSKASLGKSAGAGERVSCSDLEAVLKRRHETLEDYLSRWAEQQKGVVDAAIAQLQLERRTPPPSPVPPTSAGRRRRPSTVTSMSAMTAKSRASRKIPSEKAINSTNEFFAAEPFTSSREEGVAGADCSACVAADTPSVLAVLIVGAKGLRNADFLGESDPYCVCEIRGKPETQFQTDVIDNNCNPKWDHLVELEGFEPGDSLVFSVYDQNDNNKDEFLGRTVLSQTLINEFGFEGKLMLADAGKGVEAYLHIKVRVAKPGVAWQSEDDVFKNLSTRNTTNSASSGNVSRLSRWSMDDRADVDALRGDAAIKDIWTNKAEEMWREPTLKPNDEAAKHHSFGQSCRWWLSCVVTSSIFESCVVLITVASAALVGWEVEYMADHKTPTLPVAFDVMQYVVCAVFVAEVLLRLVALGPVTFIRGDDYIWNSFDVIVVVVAILEVMLTTLTTGEYSVLLLARTIRVVRIIRVVRVIQWLKELKQMLYAIFITFQSLVWAIILMLLMTYVCSVCFTQAVTLHLCKFDSDGSLPFYAERLRENFGTIPRSVYTLSQSFTGGVSWGVHTDNLMFLGWIFPALFFMFIAFTLFAFMNIITGFFCENAMEMAHKDKESVIQQQMKNKGKIQSEFQDIFSSIDRDSSGDLTFAEFEDHMQDEAMKAYLSHLDLHVKDAWEIFRVLDRDLSGTISIEEFVWGCLKLRGNAKAVDVQSLVFDVKKTQKKLTEFMEFTEQCFEQMRTGYVVQPAPSAGLNKQEVEQSNASKQAVQRAQESQRPAGNRHGPLLHYQI